MNERKNLPKILVIFVVMSSMVYGFVKTWAWGIDHALTIDTGPMFLLPLAIVISFGVGIVSRFIFNYIYHKFSITHALGLFIAIALLIYVIPIFQPIPTQTYYYKKALSTLEEKFCTKIPRYPANWFSWECVTQIAKLKNDARICNLISQEAKDDCLDQFSEESVNNPSLCNEYYWPHKARNCYLNVAEKTKNSSLCLKIVNNPDTDENEYIECVAHVSVEEAVKLCELEEYQDLCLHISVAVPAKDPSICNLIKGSPYDYRPEIGKVFIDNCIKDVNRK